MILKLLIFILYISISSAWAGPPWQFQAGGVVAGDPVVHLDRIYITGGTRLHVLDMQGKLQWSYDAQAPSLSEVAVGNKMVM